MIVLREHVPAVLTTPGINWTQIITAGITFKCLYKAQSGRIIAGTTSGLWYSDNEGSSWAQSSQTSSTFTIVGQFKNGALFACNDSNDCVRSADNGTTWEYAGTASGEITSIYPTSGTDALLAIYNAGIKKVINTTATTPSDTGVSEGIWYDIKRASDYRFFACGPTGIIRSSTGDANSAWTNINRHRGYRSLCITSTGRIIIGSSNSNSNGIYYSDDNGDTWATSLTSGAFSKIIELSTSGRLIAAGLANFGIWYSDDNGTTWQSSTSNTDSWWDLCETASGKILGIRQTELWASDNIAVPEVTAKYALTKYLDKEGAQKLVTQFKAYVDSLVGSD